jgi:hypothetical protein
MTDREKLVELLAQKCNLVKGCIGCRDRLLQSAPYRESLYGALADHLIANGVTVNGKRIEYTFSIPIDGQETLRKVIEETEVDGKTLAEWIALLKDYKQQEWISVKDRLPEDEQEVIGWEGDYAKTLYYDAELNEWDDENGWGWKLDDFPHWMPLPEPPKKEKNSRKAEDCRYYTQNSFWGAGCLGTKEIDPCKGDGCERWKPKEDA